MIRPSDETYLPFHLDKLYQYQGPLQRSINVAEHYGFRLIKPVEPQTESLEVVVPTSVNDKSDSCCPQFEERYSHLHHYLDNLDSLSYPALLCHTKKAKNKSGHLNLEVYGVEDSFVETLLLKSSYEILIKNGYRNLLIEINSFGAADSFERFDNEVAKFVTKNISKFDVEDRQKLQDSRYYIYEIDQNPNHQLTNSQENILLHRPRPVAYLSESCRTHLKELLEHLEESELPYMLRPNLFPQSGKHAETVYDIIDQNSGDVLAYGERFSTQAQSYAEKVLTEVDHTIHCAAISIKLPAGKKETYLDSANELDCQVYFAHSGAVAKRNCLKILSTLHEAGINVKHSVIKNSLREQLHHSEKTKFLLTLILGVKEVQDGTVIVRNNNQNRQKSVPINRLCSYVKRSLKSIN